MVMWLRLGGALLATLLVMACLDYFGVTSILGGRSGEDLQHETHVRLRELLQASDAKLHRLGERWEALKAKYAEKTAALKVEYSERAISQYDEAREALVEMRRELRETLQLLEFAGAPA